MVEITLEEKNPKWKNFSKTTTLLVGPKFLFHLAGTPKK
jgi:hypothetical protein